MVMSKTLYILNGPNLDRLGEREPEIYGRATLADVEAMCREAAARHELDLVFRQTHREYEMIDWLHEAARDAAGVAINPAAFSYHSVAVLDAIKMLSCPIVEVHISNIHRRDEAWRADSLLTPAVTGIISGLGVAGYRLAIEFLAERLGAA
jgi:3-dehydroquinate dehydratase-2